MDPWRRLLQDKVNFFLDLLTVLHSDAIQLPENRTWLHAAIYPSHLPAANCSRSCVCCYTSQAHVDGLDTLKHLSGK